MKQEERSELTRKKILDAAMNEFGANGYSGGTIGNICRTGINKGLVYHYFTGKDDLYLACARISCHELVKRLEDVDAVVEHGSLSDILEACMNARVKFCRECRRESRIVFECLLDPPKELRAEVREITEPLEQRNMAIFDSVVPRLKLRSGVTRERARNYFLLQMNVFNGYFSSPAMQDMSLDDRISAHEKNIPAIIDCMLYGIVDKTPDDGDAADSRKSGDNEHAVDGGRAGGRDDMAEAGKTASDDGRNGGGLS